MAVYPFYIETQAEGRNTPIAGGTRRKDGSMSTTIYQRDNGEITSPFKIQQYHEYENGGHQLVTAVSYQGKVIQKHVTDY